MSEDAGGRWTCGSAALVGLGCLGVAMGLLGWVYEGAQSALAEEAASSSRWEWVEGSVATVATPVRVPGTGGFVYVEQRIEREKGGKRADGSRISRREVLPPRWAEELEVGERTFELGGATVFDAAEGERHVEVIEGATHRFGGIRVEDPLTVAGEALPGDRFAARLVSTQPTRAAVLERLEEQAQAGWLTKWVFVLAGTSLWGVAWALRAESPAAEGPPQAGSPEAEETS